MTDAQGMHLHGKLQHFQNTMATDKSQSADSHAMSQHMRELEKQRRRNLIFDEERFEETFLKCLICRESYNDKDKMPKMLPCHHTFCLECLCQMFRVEGEFRQSLSSAFRSMPLAVKIQCPTCRDGLITSEAELRRLPNDHTIVELLTFVKDTGKCDVQYCSKHQMQPLHFFCEPCIQPVCCDCTVIDHRESKGHVVINVDDALQKYLPILNDTMAEVKAEKEEVVRQRQSLEQAAETVDQMQQDLTQHIRMVSQHIGKPFVLHYITLQEREIPDRYLKAYAQSLCAGEVLKSVFDRIRTALDEREQDLYDISNGEINRKRQTVAGHLKTLTERESSLNAQFNVLQEAKDEKDISQMFTGHKKARQVLEQKVDVPTDCVKDFNVTFQFSTRTDAAVRQQVGNLGNILFQS